MKRARLGYDFLALPRRRHPGWVGLKNSYGPLLFAPLFEIAEGAPIPIHGSDWRVWLCRVWCLTGRARSPVCKALDELAERGVIAVGKGLVSVLFRPEDEHNSSIQTTQLEHTASTETTQLEQKSRRHSDLSVENHLTPKIQTDREKERKTDSSDARARETTTTDRSGDFRKPLPEPPPNLPPREQPLGEWIAAEHAKRHVARTGTTPGGSNRYELARKVGEWATANCEAYKVSNRALATSLLDGLFASEVAGAKGWGLGWLVNSPQQFCGLPAGVQPVEAKAEKSNNPTHQVWKAPDYEAENREIAARVEREREEWFAEHPECREAAAEVDALIPKPRVVVSIAEAKPPKRAAPLNEQERQERIRLLQAQAEQIRAASAAE
jgi:hypothetical protein